MKAYPYYIVPVVEEYRKLNPDSEKARKAARLLAANIGDVASLRLILGIDPPEFARFYPDLEIQTPSTFDTIDSFLDKFGAGAPITELGIENTAAGYKLEEIPEMEKNHPDEDKSRMLVDNTEEDFASNGENYPEEEKSVGELIKNKEYVKALKIIEAQNLINPQKSIYFAHQIRFLKKLIALERFKKRAKRIEKRDP